MNVKKGDIAVVINGWNKGAVVEVGENIPADTDIDINGHACRAPKPGWWVSTYTRKLEVHVTNELFDTKRFLGNTVPELDEHLKPLVKLTEDEKEEVRLAIADKIVV